MCLGKKFSPFLFLMQNKTKKKKKMLDCTVSKKKFWKTLILKGRLSLFSHYHLLWTETREAITSRAHPISPTDDGSLGVFFFTLKKLKTEIRIYSKWEMVTSPRHPKRNSPESPFLKKTLLCFECSITADGTLSLQERFRKKKCIFHNIWGTKQPSVQLILPILQPTSSFTLECTRSLKSIHK